MFARGDDKARTKITRFARDANCVFGARYSSDLEDQLQTKLDGAVAA